MGCSGAPSSSGRVTYSSFSVFALRSNSQAVAGVVTRSTVNSHLSSASVRDVMLKLPPVSRASHFRSAASAAFAAPPSATISGFRYSST